MATKTHLIVVEDSKMGTDLACGSCYNVLMGYDEEICPSCGAFVNMDDKRKLSQEQLELMAECAN